MALVPWWLSRRSGEAPTTFTPVCFATTFLLGTPIDDSANLIVAQMLFLSGEDPERTCSSHQLAGGSITAASPLRHMQFIKTTCHLLHSQAASMVHFCCWQGPRASGLPAIAPSHPSPSMAG